MIKKKPCDIRYSPESKAFAPPVSITPFYNFSTMKSLETTAPIFREKLQGKNNNPKSSRGGDPCKANTPCWASLPWTNSSESLEAVWREGGGRGGGGQRRREGSCPGVLTCLHRLGLFRPGVKGRPVADVLILSSVGHLYTVILSTLLCSTPQ